MFRVGGEGYKYWSCALVSVSQSLCTGTLGGSEENADSDSLGLGRGLDSEFPWRCGASGP